MISNGDHVRLTYWREREGVVVQAGPEVSHVKFTDGFTLNYQNEFLEDYKPQKKSKAEPATLAPVTASSRVRVPGKSKMPDTMVWEATDKKVPFRPGSIRHVQVLLARTTLNMADYKAGGGKMNYLGWFFRQGFISKKG